MSGEDVVSVARERTGSAPSGVVTWRGWWGSGPCPSSGWLCDPTPTVRHRCPHRHTAAAKWAWARLRSRCWLCKRATERPTGQWRYCRGENDGIQKNMDGYSSSQQQQQQQQPQFNDCYKHDGGKQLAYLTSFPPWANDPKQAVRIWRNWKRVDTSCLSSSSLSSSRELWLLPESSFPMSSVTSPSPRAWGVVCSATALQ